MNDSSGGLQRMNTITYQKLTNMKKESIIKNNPIQECVTHSPILSKMGYVASFKEADRRLRKGQKQRQCPKCKRWFFEDEF